LGIGIKRDSTGAFLSIHRPGQTGSQLTDGIGGFTVELLSVLNVDSCIP